jgi:hypothetical protein
MEYFNMKDLADIQVVIGVLIVLTVIAAMMVAVQQHSVGMAFYVTGSFVFAVIASAPNEIYEWVRSRNK